MILSGPVFVLGAQLLCVMSTDSVKEAYLMAHIEKRTETSGGTFETPVYPSHVDSRMSRSDFERIVRLGIPTVFSGVARDWSEIRSVSCADFSSRWPDASMRAEYTGLSESEVFLKLGDKRWLNDTKAPKGVLSPTAECDDDEAKQSRPEVAPFVWHVKDRVSRSIKSEIAAMTKGFHFLSTDSIIDAHARDSMEFWFQQVGAGTFAHNDGYCHSVFSVQLRGQKKWRLMLAPEMKNLSRDVFDEFDSGIYDSVHKWEPDLEYVLQEGDGILFPPGYMHETRTVGGPSESDTCATSVTFNIPLPMPTKFVRTFLPRFSVSREIHQCMRRWESFVTASVKPVKWSNPVPGSEQSQTITSGLFSAIDANNDELISLSEIEQHLLRRRDEFRKSKSVYFGDVTFVFEPARELTEDMLEEALKIRAKDTLDMWDVNGDSFASRAEVRDVIEYFHFYRWRQELVDSAVSVAGPDGERMDLPIGSDAFKQRLEIVEKITAKIRPEPPILDPARYPLIATRDEL